MKIPKSFVKPIETEQQLPTLLEALHILHKFSFYHNKAITEYGSNNYTMASYWYNKAQTFLNNHLIQKSMIQEIQPKYSVHNATHNTYLVPNPNGLQGNYIFSLEKDKIVWFDNQLFTEVMVQRYNEQYPECTFKLIQNNGS